MTPVSSSPVIFLISKNPSDTVKKSLGTRQSISRLLAPLVPFIRIRFRQMIADDLLISSEAAEAMKLKQISKALRSDEGKGAKQYVVSRKGKKGVKGAVMVDKRQKSDKRSMDRALKKRKSGKKGGMTGTKKRRHHS